ncbi:MAG: YjbH domain-containing protein, partial [Candidatus Deferrimicrobiaceae bacterium]
MTRKPRATFIRTVASSLLRAVVFLLLSSFASADDFPFTYPSNQGLTGLMETPTARVMPENRYRIGASVVDPYRQYYGTIGLFPRLEVNGRITEVRGVPGFSDFGGYGDFKDKAIDAKLQIFREGKYTPALAVAVMDPHGTRIYSSQAIIASKQLFPFDFSLGWGNGRLGKRPLSSSGDSFRFELLTDPGQWLRDAKAFGGIQFSPSERFSLLAEYSPIDYHRQTTDPAQPRYFTDPVPSRFNFGLRVKPTRWSEIDVTYQRGNQLGVNFSVAFDIGRPMIPIYDSPYREGTEHLSDPLSDRIAAGLAASGFSDIGVN